MCIRQRYKQSYKEANLLLERGYSIAPELQKRVSGVERFEIGSICFAKLICHTRALLRLLPKGPLGSTPDERELWDLSSVAVLARASLEAYYAMYYFMFDEVSEEKHDFRLLVWSYHCDIRRLQILKEIGSVSDYLPVLQNEVNSTKERIVTHSVYGLMDNNEKRRVRSGEKSFLVSQEVILERAGIPKNYYRAVYKYLSFYAHTHPFSIDQLGVFRAEEEESLHVIMMVLNYNTAFFCFAFKDLNEKYGDLLQGLTDEERSCVGAWVATLQGFPQS